MSSHFIITAIYIGFSSLGFRALIKYFFGTKTKMAVKIKARHTHVSPELWRITEGQRIVHVVY